MNPLLVPAAVLTLLTFCSPDRDRQNRESGMAGGYSSNDTTGNSAEEATLTPADVLSKMTVANAAESRVASVVARQTRSPVVKQVARKLAVDHARNLEQLRALVQKLNLSLTSDQDGVVADTALPPNHQGKSGAELDQAFVQHEIEEHQANIEMIRTRMIPAAQNEEIRSYLQKTLTEMEGHLAALKRVEQQLSA